MLLLCSLRREGETMEETDYGKVAEQAKALAQIFNNGQNSSGNQLDIEKVMGIFNILQAGSTTQYGRTDTTQSVADAQVADPGPTQRTARLDMDTHIGSSTAEIKLGTTQREDRSIADIYASSGRMAPDAGIQAVKAAIPYLEHRYQKKMLLFLKVIEIHRLMDMYGQMTANVGPQAADWRREMLTVFRPYIAPDKYAMVDLIIKFTEIKEIVHGMEEIRRGKH